MRVFDSNSKTRDYLAAMAEYADEFAGIPMPLENSHLVIEPRHKLAELLNRRGEDENPGITVHNTFWSRRLRTEVCIWREADGSLKWGPLAPSNHLAMDLATMGCSVAWSIEAEAKAVQMLAGLVGHVAFRYYLLTGMFLETSKRSGVTYLFRKLRPTIALRPSKSGGDMRILAALCAHPIGYYEGTWAGSMTPTDDVIAHLLMMRADEHFFWRRCNQHAPWRHEAGM